MWHEAACAGATASSDPSGSRPCRSRSHVLPTSSRDVDCLRSRRRHSLRRSARGARRVQWPAAKHRAAGRGHCRAGEGGVMSGETRLGESGRWDHAVAGVSPARGTGSRCAGSTRNSSVESGALERATAALCARWKSTIVLVLAAGPRRRSELDRCLPADVSQKVLTEQLRGLEADGLVRRVDYRALRRAGQRHVSYELTPAGKEVSSIVQALAQWAMTHDGRDADGMRRGRVPNERAIAQAPTSHADATRRRSDLND